MNFDSNDQLIQKIFNLLSGLESRISHIESQLKLTALPSDIQESISEKKILSADEREDELEFEIGQKLFAKVGIVVLAIGIIYFLTLPYENLPAFLPSLFGYILCAGMFVLSYIGRKSFEQISGYLRGGALLLVYFSTLRLHFFSSLQIVSEITFEVILLMVVVAINLFIAIKRKSVYLTYWGLLLAYITGIVSDSHLYLFGMVTLASSLAVYFSLKYQWYSLIFFGIFFSYLTHFNWFINNPILGNQIETISYPVNLLFLLSYTYIFAIGNYARDKSITENYSIILNTFLNIGGGYGLFVFITLLTEPSYVGFYHLTASVLFIALSFAFWFKENSIYSTFFFAITGYLALSLAIISQFQGEAVFIWLCWQSLVVVSTAVWFRSKYIVVANFAIYLIVFIAYLSIEGSIGFVSTSFGIVALLSARILNWKKDLLDLKTEQMRNAYLVSALLIIPYALYHSLPSTYVSFSWIAVALLYYLFSIILKNKKYRWMSLLTLLMTVVYVFVIGITSNDLTYKIVSFFVVGIVLLITSLIYTRRMAKTKENESKNNG